MRVIAGSLGGRTFAAPTGERTRPMSDKMRGALFNALGDITGLTILDAFSGSGAMSIEALSRGAKHATAIDIDKSAQRIIVDNIVQLQLTNKLKAIRANATGWSDNNPDSLFDIVILDPPYNDVQSHTLAILAQHVRTHGVLVISLPPSFEFELGTAFELLSQKSYGDSQLVFYRKIA